MYIKEKDPVGSKVLERNVFVSSSEIKAKKEQSDHEGDYDEDAMGEIFDCDVHDQNLPLIRSDKSVLEDLHLAKYWRRRGRWCCCCCCCGWGSNWS